MIYFLKGIVSYINDGKIILDVNKVGYEIMVPSINDFVIGKEQEIFIKEIYKEDDHYLVGFDSLDKKEVFELLQKVKGIGPKTAMQILANVKPRDFMEAIYNNDLNYLKKIPGIGVRNASQILLDLKGFYSVINKQNDNFADVKLALKNLGYSSLTIEKAIIDSNLKGLTNDEILKVLLRKIVKIGNE